LHPRHAKSHFVSHELQRLKPLFHRICSSAYSFLHGSQVLHAHFGRPRRPICPRKRDSHCTICGFHAGSDTLSSGSEADGIEMFWHSLNEPFIATNPSPSPMNSNPTGWLAECNTSA
jgi:hypothetical protein